MPATLGMQSQVLLTGAEQTVYTVPAGTISYIPKTLWFTRVDGDTATQVDVVKVYIVEPGKALETKSLLEVVYLNPRGRAIINPDIFLQTGWKIIIKSTLSNATTFHLSGVSIV